jgi:DNA-binding transcriptional regulator YiaG
MTEPTAPVTGDASASIPLVPFVDRHAGCGGVFIATTIVKTESMVGLTATVERRVMRCSKCELERRSPDQVEGDYLATMAAIRERHGLLTHQEIRRIRESLGVTPDEFDALIGLPTGISKGWETQRHLQNATADARVRALQDVEYAKGVAVGARVTLRLTEEERAAFRPPSFLKKKGAAAVNADAPEEAKEEAPTSSASPPQSSPVPPSSPDASP